MALKRTRYKMPDFIRDVLNARGLMDPYRAHPAYQQNDYIGSLCVTRAKLEATRQKRFNQMLDELEQGDVYMNMEWTKNHTLFYSHYIENPSAVVEFFPARLALQCGLGGAR